MIRTTFVLINHLIWTTVLGTVIILISPFDRFGRTGGKIMRLWSWIMLKASGVRYRISGLDKLDRARHYFFAANHESAFDIPLCFSGLPFHVVSLAKIELKNVPFLGWAMRCTKHIFIDRYRMRKAVETIREAEKSLRKNPRSVLIFPEGERTVTSKMFPFKRGALRLAIKVGMPVVPMAICGTMQINKMGSYIIKGGDVELRIDHPVETIEWQGKDAQDFTDLIEEKVSFMRDAWHTKMNQVKT
ncbi:MAG TPA: 1-acyl-sn-glycerol-3-phosphate acyltransferase [Candidatus Marinimicrobia bacterium]|nr:1-acyl-sn-glycerol-3-phosphate acyltransferase [Candidatus Neomarinimicrobiota bacterium]HIM83786.1 1-acyl-sn-glycerol-3-phosphate acyltransferase [Candidatus Neomarinimicrobiota bacterium]